MCKVLASAVVLLALTASANAAANITTDGAKGQTNSSIAANGTITGTTTFTSVTIQVKINGVYVDKGQAQIIIGSDGKITWKGNTVTIGSGTYDVRAKLVVTDPNNPIYSNELKGIVVP